MSTTIDRHMTVRDARKLLSNTFGQPPELIYQAEMLIRELQSGRSDYAPGGGLMVVMCKNCGNATWSLHSDGDDELWGCDRCHMAPMSDEQAMALRRARAERAALA